MVKRTPEETKARRDAIIKQIHEQGIWSFTYRELAERHNVSTTQIFKDLRFIFNHIPKDELDIVKCKLKLLHEQNLRVLEPLIRDTDKKVQLQAIEQRGKEIERFTKFLESWGLKEKIAEKLEHSQKEPLKIEFVIVE